MDSEAHIVMLECQLVAAEERASLWERIAGAREGENARLRQQLQTVALEDDDWTPAYEYAL